VHLSNINAPMTVDFPARLRLAQLPTPLQPLDRLSAKVGGPRLWVKRDDLTGSALSGNKVRKLEFSTGEALQQQCDTLITCGGVQSNHCRATAIVGAQVGLHVHLCLRGTPEELPAGNLFLDYLAGATVSYYEPGEYIARRDEILAEIQDRYARSGHKAFIIPPGASDEVGLWGYIAACAELKADCVRLGFAPDHIVCAVGSGGTLAGLILGNALYDLGARVWSVNVDEDAAYFKAKIRADFEKWKARYDQELDVDGLPIHVIEGYLGAGYGKAGPEVLATIRRVATAEGSILDPVYTGKTFHGLLGEMERGRFRGAKNIIFIHTGGIFGLLVEHSEFHFDIRAGHE
jgi:D-cysteine desulfhydrase